MSFFDSYLNKIAKYDGEDGSSLEAKVYLAMLKPGISLEAAMETLSEISLMIPEHPETIPIFESLIRDSRQPGWLRLLAALICNNRQGVSDHVKHVAKLEQIFVDLDRVGVTLTDFDAFGDLSPADRLKLAPYVSMRKGILSIEELNVLALEGYVPSRDLDLTYVISPLAEDDVKNITGLKTMLGASYFKLIRRALFDNFERLYDRQSPWWDLVEDAATNETVFNLTLEVPLSKFRNWLHSNDPLEDYAAALVFAGSEESWSNVLDDNDAWAMINSPAFDNDFHLTVSPSQPGVNWYEIYLELARRGDSSAVYGMSAAKHQYGSGLMGMRITDLWEFYKNLEAHRDAFMSEFTFEFQKVYSGREASEDPKLRAALLAKLTDEMLQDLLNPPEAYYNPDGVAFDIFKSQLTTPKKVIALHSSISSVLFDAGEAQDAIRADMSEDYLMAWARKVPARSIVLYMQREQESSFRLKRLLDEVFASVTSPQAKALLAHRMKLLSDPQQSYSRTDGLRTSTLFDLAETVEQVVKHS